MSKKIQIAPSMMCANFIELKKDLDTFQELGIDYLHIDVMDGHYVPNMTLGIDYCRALDAYSDIPLDIHLMIEDPDRYIPVFTGFKNSIVCFHPEPVYHPIRTLQLARSHGVKTGIGIDPALSLESVKDMLPHVDMICMMTVSPGYAGQKVIPEVINKMKLFSDYIKDKDYDITIEVDGNVSWENIPKMIEAGAEILVAGSSSLFDKNGDLKSNHKKMIDIISKY